MVRHPRKTMNTYQPVLLLARKNLIALAVVVVVCVASVVGLGQLADAMQTSLAQSQAALQAQKAQLETKQTDLANVREHIQQYSALRAQGLVGEPDRALWVETLQDSYRRAQLPAGLVVRLLAPKPLADSGAPGAVADPSQSEPLVHDLEFEMRNVVESDVLGLIRDYQAEVKGRLRVNFCKLTDPQDGGLTAQCVLRFISIPVPPAPAM
jgi:hypothetical protein